MNVSVQRREPARGAALRLEGAPTPEAVGRLWGRILLRCGGLPSAGPAFGLRFGGEAYAACWALPAGVPLPEGLGEAEMPGGWYAAALHAGGYDGIGETLRRLREEWLPHGGFRLREGPVVERYLVDPREAAEAELRTEVCLPVLPDPIE